MRYIWVWVKIGVPSRPVNVLVIFGVNLLEQPLSGKVQVKEMPNR